jgi:hypothetical protein
LNLGFDKYEAGVTTTGPERHDRSIKKAMPETFFDNSYLTTNTKKIRTTTAAYVQ